jgi:L-ascorbate metabolism protein UlaG (beta-lactamase superfamily)
MQITWYGQSCFKIVSGQTTIVLDPFSKDTGLTPPRGKADLLLVSDSNIAADDFSQIDAEFIIDGAGEYEVGGIYINGIAVFHKDEDDNIVKVSTMYTIEVEDVKICHLADFSKEQVVGILDKIGQVDILMIPVGGHYKLGKIEIASLDADKALGVVGDIDPRVVIPMNFKIPKLKVSLEDSEKFLKSTGDANPEALEKYTVKKKDLPQEGRDIILLRVV